MGLTWRHHNGSLGVLNASRCLLDNIPRTTTPALFPNLHSTLLTPHPAPTPNPPSTQSPLQHPCCLPHQSPTSKVWQMNRNTTDSYRLLRLDPNTKVNDSSRPVRLTHTALTSTARRAGRRRAEQTVNAYPTKSATALPQDLLQDSCCRDEEELGKSSHCCVAELRRAAAHPRKSKSTRGAARCE